MTNTILITHGSLAARIRPALGGSLASLTHGAQEILRTTPPHTADPTASAAFPLVPFSGRIAQGAFRFEQTDVVLPANLPPEPHAIHGQGWQHAWSVVTHNESAAELAFRYERGPWPWNYEARQRFALQDQQLTVALDLTNRSRRPMPAGLGWHPYFLKQDAVLTAPVTAWWPMNQQRLPSEAPEALDSTAPLRAGQLVAALDLDHPFACAPAPVQIRWPARGLTVSLQASSNLRHLVLYTPPDEDFFCVEPVSHVPNAVNTRLPASVSGLRVLAPDESMEAHIVLRVEAGALNG